MERINNNAYKVDLPSDYRVSATFNIAYLSPYLEDNYLEDLRENSPSQGENDGGPSLGMITSSTKTKGNLKDDIYEALEAEEVRTPRTVSGTVAQWPVRHPGCAPCKLPSFVLVIN